VSKDDYDLLEILEEGVKASVRLLVQKAQRGEANASDIAQLRGLYKDAGGSMTFRGRSNEVGDEVLDSMADVDVDLLN
jgi:hypothetical protein